MTRILTLFIILIHTSNLVAQRSYPGINTICYHSTTNYHTKYIPRTAIKNARKASKKSARFIVNYIGFTTEARNAFQYAVDIWSELLFSEVPIRISASWSQLSAGVLGNAGPARFYSDFDGAPLDGIVYPVALAEKLARQELNPSNQSDINANFNSEIDWYFGTDGNTPAGTTDLVSVVLHELGHGLGFSDSFFANAVQGIWGSSINSSQPVIYDYFVVNDLNQLLIDSSIFANPSSELKEQLESGKLFFNSSIIKGNLPQLFAPAPFSGGSSIAHLDEQLYPPGSSNSLMTPQIGQAEASHDPGELGLSIFYEMGWLYTFIEHQPISIFEPLDVPILIETVVESDTTLSEVALVYSEDEFESQNVLLMNEDSHMGLYSASIPPTGASRQISYYIRVVENGTKRTYTLPVNAPNEFNTFSVGPDLDPPLIDHKPVEFAFINNDSLRIKTNVSDISGLDTVFATFIVNEEIINIAMKEISPNEYKGVLPISNSMFSSSAVVSYSIEAIDNALANNSSETPIYSVEFIDFGESVTSYSQTFEQNLGFDDFALLDWSISSEVGFVGNSLNSEHPYSNDTDALAFLIRPITTRNGPLSLSFDEIVLVEPGTNTIFPSEEFKDYVVVEFSEDNGINWSSIEDGYDSRDDEMWLTTYNSAIVDTNSLANGNTELFRRKTIDLPNSSDNDILIRFRLVSDAFGYGWGWLVDNIAIGEPITGIPSVKVEPSLILYPNPSNGVVKLLNPADVNIKRLQVFGPYGKLVSRYNEVSRQKIIELPNKLNKGSYIIEIETDNSVVHRRILVK
ncbi:MAG: T9SS type A sorting domain-containing protein [Bacteroidota bacterium]